MKIAIVGATGNVGRTILASLLQDIGIAATQLKLFASATSESQVLISGNHSFVINSISQDAFSDCYLAIFATPAAVSSKYVPIALAAGTRVIDSSSHYRLAKHVPLIVPPVNAHLINTTKRLYAHANCIVSPLAIVLKPLNDYVNIARINVASYQSVAGAGKAAMDELANETGQFYHPQNMANSVNPPKYFSRSIVHNVIPAIGTIMANGHSSEEDKIKQELQKIITPTFRVSATAVRVPVMIGHAIAVAIEFKYPIQLKTINHILANSPAIILSTADYHTPIEIVGQEQVFVGRIRRDTSISNGLLMWLVADNLRRGAATDAIEIALAILLQDQQISDYFGVTGRN